MQPEGSTHKPKAKAKSGSKKRKADGEAEAGEGDGNDGDKQGAETETNPASTTKKAAKVGAGRPSTTDAAEQARQALLAKLQGALNSGGDA